MLIRVLGGVVHGIQGELVEIEVHTGRGLPGLVMVGRPGASVRESGARVRAAVLSAGFKYPKKRIVVNLAPADRPKHGTGLDLPLAVGLIATERGWPTDHPAARHLLIGEVSLDGSVRPVRGVLPMVLASRAMSLIGILVPRANAAEAAIASRVPVHAVEHLTEAIAHLEGERRLAAHDPDLDLDEATSSAPDPDVGAVRGQDHAKRALLLAAAGGHNLLFTGPPGSGKTLLARCLVGLLPPMSREESLETTAVHSVAGQLDGPLLRGRPFRAPHHSVSEAGFLGGGAELRPGEVSLAHNGVLFLDETLEFPRRLLDLLRQPLEEGRYTLTRRRGSRSFPSRILLIGATNP